MSSFFEKIDEYEGIREATFLVSQTALKRRIQNDISLSRIANVSIRLGPLDEAAIQNWHGTWAKQSKFPWDRLWSDFRPYIDRFEVAIWADGQVCGLALGRPSGGNQNVTIHFIERNMGANNPFGGLVIRTVVDVATFYARALGKEWVKIKDPVPGAIRAYLEVGFVQAAKIGRIEYLERKADP